MTDDDGSADVDDLAERLAARFPGVPVDSVRQVATAAWAEAMHHPVPDVASELAEMAAAESLIHYPVPPVGPASPGELGAGPPPA